MNIRDIKLPELLSMIDAADQAGDDVRPDAVYVYSPICGTCKLGEEMLRMVQHALPQLQLYRLDLNMSPETAAHYKIHSIPCLMVWPHHSKHESMPELHYALHSVTHLFTLLGGGRMDD
ncbi:thioredoxin family protein [Paenibacillus marinisediminis]